MRSCHDLSEGGLAAAVAEMSFAGECGVELDLAQLSRESGISDHAVLLFSESNTRFVVEAAAGHREQFLSCFAGVPVVEIGSVTGSRRMHVRGAGGRTVIDAAWTDLKRAWQSPLMWDIIAISTYLTGSAIYLYLPLIPDFARCRDRLADQAPVCP